jgi:hypothetical protein
MYRTIRRTLVCQTLVCQTLIRRALACQTWFEWNAYSIHILFASYPHPQADVMQESRAFPPPATARLSLRAKATPTASNGSVMRHSA